MLMEPKCSIRNCKWYIGVSQNVDSAGFGDLNQFHICPAYPNFPGIPFAICYGEDAHLEKRPDQFGDYIYELKTLKDEEEERKRIKEISDQIDEEDEE